MPYRKAHGSAKANGHIYEELPFDELPDPLPVDPAVVAAPLARRPDGAFASSEAARAAGRKGGLTKAARRRDFQRMGLVKLSQDNDFYPYWVAAKAWATQFEQDIALACGGIVGAGPMAIIGCAAGALARARWANDAGAKLDDVKERLEFFSRANTFEKEARTSIGAAYSSAHLFGVARANGNGTMTDPFAVMAKMQQFDDFIDVDGTPAPPKT